MKIQWASHLKFELKSIPDDFAKLSIEEYCDLTYCFKGRRVKTISWNNYIPLFDRIYRKNISKYLFITHELGMIRKFDIATKKLVQHNAQVAFDHLYKMVLESKQQVILNLDIDYTSLGKHPLKDFSKLIDQAIKVVFDQLLDAYFFTDKVKAFTIALSPECCGGWESSLEVYNQLATLFHLDKIHLPGRNKE